MIRYLIAGVVIGFVLKAYGSQVYVYLFDDRHECEFDNDAGVYRTIIKPCLANRIISYLRGKG